MLTEKEKQEIYRSEGIEKGRAEGRAEAIKEVYLTYLKMSDHDKALKQIMSIFKISKDEANKIIE